MIAREILEAAYVFLPAGIANSTPPLLTKFFGLRSAIDGGRSWRGQPLFGSHKTWLGLIGGTIAGIITFVLQRQFDHLAVPIFAAFTMSFGALAGDLAKSFFKRRFAVAPGKVWFPLDQIDYILGAILLTAPFLRLSLTTAAMIVVIYFVLHLIVSALGYLAGTKDTPL